MLICFIYESKKWRKRNALEIASVCMACSNPNAVRVDTIDITCDCDKFQTDGECNHIKPLSNDNRIREKLNGILGCRIDAYGFDTSINGWSVFSIRALPFDNTTMYKVYQRYHLSSVLNTSNTVIMDGSRRTVDYVFSSNYALIAYHAHHHYVTEDYVFMKMLA